jgi:hypothetical protein
MTDNASNCETVVTNTRDADGGSTFGISEACSDGNSVSYSVGGCWNDIPVKRWDQDESSSTSEDLLAEGPPLVFTSNINSGGESQKPKARDIRPKLTKENLQGRSLKVSGENGKWFHVHRVTNY